MRRRGRPGLVGTVARTAVVAGTAGRVSHRQQQRFAAQDQQAYEQEVAAAPPPPPAPAAELSMDDKLAQLKQLGELRDQGILTEAEFEASKAKVLG